jgi:hypothetical protein
MASTPRGKGREGGSTFHRGSMDTSHRDSNSSQIRSTTPGRRRQESSRCSTLYRSRSSHSATWALGTGTRTADHPSRRPIRMGPRAHRRHSCTRCLRGVAVRMAHTRSRRFDRPSTWRPGSRAARRRRRTRNDRRDAYPGGRNSEAYRARRRRRDRPGRWDNFRPNSRNSRAARGKRRRNGFCPGGSPERRTQRGGCICHCTIFRLVGRVAPTPSPQRRTGRTS